MSAQKRQRAQTGSVIVWGCPVKQRLVRGRLAAGTKLPRKTIVDGATAAVVAVSCPVCQQEHAVQAITRPRRPGETFDVDPVELRSLPRKRGH